MNKKKLAVVAVSGGLDSCVTAAIANKEYDLRWHILITVSVHRQES